MEIIPLLQKKFEITIIAPDFTGEKADNPNVKTFYVPLGRWKFGDYQFASWKPSMIKKIMKNQDIVFNQTLGTIGVNAIRIAKKQKKPVFSFIHSIDWELASKSLGGMQSIQRLVKGIARRYYKKCQKLFFPAQQAQLRYEEQGIIRPSAIIPLGVDPQRFKPSHSKAVAKRRIHIEPSKIIIGFCGRIGREKDLFTLKKAFEIIRQEQPAQLLIVGEGIPGMGLEGEDIILAGRQDNVVPYLQAMDIYVLPSLTETTSLSTLEAMSCGLPVICTPVGALKTYIKHTENGFLFPRGNVEQLIVYIKQLIANPNQRDTIGRAARKTVREQFNWKKTAKNIERELKH